MTGQVRRAVRVLLPGVLAVVAALTAGSAAAADTVTAYFTRDDRLQAVERPLPAGADPVRRAAAALFAGPTGPERRDGIRTAIPARTPLDDVQVVGGVAFLRVPESFASGGTGNTVGIRLAQVVHTLMRVSGVAGVRILLGAEPMPGPGEDTGAVLTRASLTPREIIGPVPVTVRQVQARLIRLRYMPAGTATGRLDYRTSQSLLAFQASEGLSRSGTATLQTRRRLKIARTPAARVASRSRRIEVNRSRGVALLIEGGAVRRVVHVSTGAGGRTPRGTFRIYRKERMSWSHPFSVWLPFASYFSGGFAFHQYPNVPAYSASHGCIRVGSPDAPAVFAFAAMGTVVHIT